MSFTKAKIYNLTLSALLLNKEVTDVESDKSNEVRILNTHYEVALWSTLQDLDLDALSVRIPLELLVTLDDGPWSQVYRYPDNCAFLRRIESLQITDTRCTHISKRTALYNGDRAIYTNEIQAVAECIPKDVPLAALNAMAGMALSYKLAFLSAPLVVGKGSKTLRDKLEQAYVLAKSDAQRIDASENFNYEAETTRSEFVAERLS